MSAPAAGLLETCRGTVYPWQCDHMNHMNVMWYVGKFDEATWNLFSMLGMSAAWLREHGRGMAAPTWTRRPGGRWRGRTSGSCGRASDSCSMRCPGTRGPRRA